jgi:hypothetical protein
MQAKALPHMNELLTLKSYSDEKEDQRQWVASKEEQFTHILKAVDDGSIKSYASQNAVIQEFGEPIIRDGIQDHGQVLTRWLYRHPIQRFASDRVYLYFSSDGHLTKSEHIPPGS